MRLRRRAQPRSRDNGKATEIKSKNNINVTHGKGSKGAGIGRGGKGMKECLTAMESIGVPCPQFVDCIDHLHFSLISLLLQKLLHALRMTFKAPLPTTLPSPRGCKNLEKMASVPLYAYQSKGCGERVSRQVTFNMQVSMGMALQQGSWRSQTA